MTHTRQKSYVNVRRRDLEFEVSDWVYLKISPMRVIMRFEKKDNLSLRYVGPYKILKHVRKLSFQLDFSCDLASCIELSMSSY